jgi:hypothetical protein
VGCDEDMKEQLKRNLAEVVKWDKFIIIENSRIRCEEVMGHFGEGKRNNEGRNLLHMCIRNGWVKAVCVSKQIKS